MSTPTLAASSRRQIRCTSGSKSVAGLGATVQMFKAVVAKSCKVWPPQHRLIHNGQILKNEKILARIPVIFQDDLAQLTGDVPSFKHADGQAKYSGDVPNMLLHENGYGK